MSTRPNQKLVLITGGSGFAAQYVRSEFLRAGYDVMSTSRQPKRASDGTTHIQLDIRDCGAVKKAIQTSKPAAIVHLAAQTRGWFEHTTELITANLLATVNLYEAILQIQATDATYNPKILYVSSSEAYGDSPSRHDLKEESPLRPVNPYGITKAAADQISQYYAANRGLHIIIARPFSHLGPGQSPDFLLAGIAKKLASFEHKPRQHVIETGPLDAVRDYLDVRDIAHAYRMILEAGPKPGTIFNVCSGVPQRVRGVVKALLALSPMSVTLNEAALQGRPVDTMYVVGNSDALRRATGWSSRHILVETLQAMLEYQRTLNTTKI